MRSKKIERGASEFPPALLDLKPTPSAIWLQGELPPQPSIAIVGTRHPSPEANRFAFDLAATLSQAGWAIWSGGALGIDQQAHEGALETGGSTVLVAGGGLERPYPAALASLWPRVLERGALLAVVPEEHPPQRWTFFARNAVLAAMTQALVIVECPLQSGARNAAATARKLGRPVWIGAQAPWSPFASTVREELRLGARLLLHPEDLLLSNTKVELQAPSVRTVPHSNKRRRPSSPQQPTLPEMSQLPEIQQQILRAVGSGSTHLDLLCKALEASPSEILQQTSFLQLEGLLEESEQGFFVGKGVVFYPPSSTES